MKGTLQGEQLNIYCITNIKRSKIIYYYLSHISYHYIPLHFKYYISHITFHYSGVPKHSYKQLDECSRKTTRSKPFVGLVLFQGCGETLEI